MPIQALRRLLCLASVSAVHRASHMEGPPWPGSHSVDRHIRHLKEHPGWVLLCSSVCQAFDEPASLMFSCQCWLCGEREAMVMAPPPTRDSAVSPCFHGFLACLHQHFPPRSPPSHPPNPSLHSQHQLLPWDCSTIPKLWLPACLGSIWLQQGLSDSHSI